MININDMLNFMNPLKVIKGFVQSTQLNWTLAGAVVSGIASNTAAQDVKRGQGNAMETNKKSLGVAGDMRDQSIANYTPYQDAGTRGLAGYEQAMGNQPTWGGFGAAEFNQYKDPGYQWRQEQGMQGLERMFSQRGQNFSGTKFTGLMNYNQGLASQEFGAARNRAISDYGMQRQEGLDTLGQNQYLANMGYNTAGALGNLNSNYSSQVANINSSIAGNQVGRANASAAGVMGVGNAINSGIGGMQYQSNFNKYMSNAYPGSGGGGAFNAPTGGFAGPASAGDAYMPAFQRR